MKKNRLWISVLSFCALSIGVLFGTGHFTAFSVNLTKAATNNVVTSDAITTLETFIVDDISYRITGNKTVAVDDLSTDFTKKTLAIPSTVNYKDQSYTVTSVELDHLTKSYQTVKEIVIPNTVTKQVIIKRTHFAEFMKSYNEDEYSDTSEAYWNELVDENNKKNFNPINIQAFPVLHKITFLSTTAPKKIAIEKYVDTKDLLFEVPRKAKKKYQKVTQKILVRAMSHYDDWEGLHTYKSLKITPTITSKEDANPETHIFSTSDGIYLVKKEAGNGIGKVILLYAKRAQKIKSFSSHIYWNSTREYTLASEIKNGPYKYKLDEIASCALRNIICTIFVVPDTVTTLNSESMPLVPNYVFISKNCTKLPNHLFIATEDLPPVELIYASNVTKTDKYTFSNARVNTLVINKKARISNSIIKQKQVEDIFRVDRQITGASIKAPKSITLKITEQTKNLSASLSKNTGEHLKYIVLSNYRQDNLSCLTVSSKGNLTPKRAATLYVMVYSLESGKHTYVKVNIKNKTFKKGIFTYAINYSGTGKHTVTLKKCTPDKHLKTLTIPSTVTYQGKVYKVTGAYAENTYQDFKYLAINEYYLMKPIIPDSLAKKCNITKIIIPSTMTKGIILTSKLPKLKKIICQGSTAPICLCFYAKTMSQVKVYVPKKAYSNYKYKIEGNGNNWESCSSKNFIKTCIKKY